MNEEVKLFMDDAKEQMENALNHLENELAKIRAGRANPKILNDVLVEYYGTPCCLQKSHIFLRTTKGCAYAYAHPFLQGFS